MHISSISNNLYTQKTTMAQSLQTASVKNQVNDMQNLQTLSKFQNLSNVSFSGLMRMGKEFTKPVDSAFFRDYPALMSAVNILRENFPDGAEILDYACSDGEEAISLYALLGNDRSKFKITGIDINDDVLNLANQGVYSLFGGFLDSYLMPGAEKDPTQKDLAKMFYEIMEPAKEPKERLNNSLEFSRVLYGSEPKFRKEIFFKLNDKVKDNLEFRAGDIFKVDEEKTDKKVGAVIFRNAFYHLMDSYDGQNLFTGDIAEQQRELDKEFFTDEEIESMNEQNEGMYAKKSLGEKQTIADEIIDKAYNKLEVGGVFVLGNSANENIFIAPEDAPKEDTIRLGDTKLYKDTKKAMDDALVYYKSTQNASDSLLGFEDEDDDDKIDMAAIFEKQYENFRKRADVRVLKKTPMQKALEKDGRFKPVYASPVAEMEGLGLEMPTVWVKVK